MSRKINKISPLEISLLTPSSSSLLSFTKKKTIAPTMTEIPPIYANNTGWNRLIFCLIDTIIIAAIVAQKVAIIVGRKISVGVAELREDLVAMILTGISVSPLA